MHAVDATVIVASVETSVRCTLMPARAHVGRMGLAVHSIRTAGNTLPGVWDQQATASVGQKLQVEQGLRAEYAIRRRVLRQYMEYERRAALGKRRAKGELAAGKPLIALFVWDS